MNCSVYFAANSKISAEAILPFELYSALCTYNGVFMILAVWWTWSSGKCLFLPCEWLSVWLSALLLWLC